MTSSDGTQTLSGRVFATGEGRIKRIGNFAIEAVPSGFMLVTKNKDVTGVIGQIGTVLGESGVNISQFSLGRQQPGGEGLAVVELDGVVEEDVLDQLRSIEAIILVKHVKL